MSFEKSHTDYIRTCPLCREEFVGWAEHIAVNMLVFHIEIYHQDWIKRGPGHFAKIEEPKMFEYTAHCPFCKYGFTSPHSMEDAHMQVCDHIEIAHEDKFSEKTTTRWQDTQVILSNVLMFLLGLVFVLQVFFNIDLRYIILTGVMWIVLGQVYAEIRANERCNS